MKTRKVDSLARRRSQSIECEKAGLIFRKINIYPPSQNSILNRMVFEYKLQRGAIAEILKELSHKQPIIDLESMLDLGDQIRGEILECTSTVPIKRSETGSFSGRHRANYAVAENYVYCRVYKGFY